MTRRVLCGALAALAVGPAAPARAQPDLPVPIPWLVLRDLIPLPVINEACMRRYEDVEGDVCVPVEDDTGTLQFVMDQM